MENNKNKKSVKFQGDMLNFYDFIQVYVFTTNHHLNWTELQIGKMDSYGWIVIERKSILTVLQDDWRGDNERQWDPVYSWKGSAVSGSRNPDR